MKIRLLAVGAALVVANMQTAGADPVLVNGVSCETHTLFAGRNIDAGTVTVCEDGNISFHAADGWRLTETHLEVADSPAAIPQRNGNPTVGHFEYKREYDPPVQSDGYQVGALSDPSYIAAHAAMLQLQEACTDFDDGFNEKDRVDFVQTENGQIGFRMVETAPLVTLSVGDTATFTPGVYPNDLPIVASPDTSPPLEDIVAFTYNDVAGGNPIRDDYIADANGTDAGGNTLTDPQDTSQVPLLWHAFSQGLAILVDFSAVAELWSVSVNGIDLDFTERWQFQFFDGADALLEQQEVVGVDQSGDGAAFPVSSVDGQIDKMAVWGGNNLGVADRIGFAIDNVCTSAVVAEETGWGDGQAFDGANWATYIVFQTAPSD